MEYLLLPLPGLKPHSFKNPSEPQQKNMKKKLPELAGEEQWGAQEGDYAASEGKNHVFQMWLEEVPQELKIGNDLEPEFKKHVRNYVLSTQGFDPYENDEQQETEIPSSDELESWFNP